MCVQNWVNCVIVLPVRLFSGWAGSISEASVKVGRGLNILTHIHYVIGKNGYGGGFQCGKESEDNQQHSGDLCKVFKHESAGRIYRGADQSVSRLCKKKRARHIRKLDLVPSILSWIPRINNVKLLGLEEISNNTQLWGIYVHLGVSNNPLESCLCWHSLCNSGVKYNCVSVEQKESLSKNFSIGAAGVGIVINAYPLEGTKKSLKRSWNKRRILKSTACNHSSEGAKRSRWRAAIQNRVLSMDVFAENGAWSNIF